MSGTTAESTWALGDYPEMARRLRPAADTAVATAALEPGTTLLDVGCGTGNAALAAARLGATVTGADPTARLLSLAAERARGERLPITWLHADTTGLTGAFDRVVSVFGAMYAPDHRQAADAMLRCCTPGGRIVSAAWTPDGFMAAANRVLAAYLPPPPPGARPPSEWGELAYLQDLFAPHHITATTRGVPFHFPSALEAAEFWTRTAGHLQAERPRIEAQGTWTALHHDLAALFTEHNQASSEPDDTTVLITSEYLLATITPA
ncbi:MAG TPA: class I SAM-dependent methyltransferase [Yinghuangia sp.]|uniref:class I SAM-dependent methyltransferase n=1 Tax=Yinghuangia sp. YIM S10712 TaxID=3436930 RepID=UPI002C4730B7|nr:class I SAM-dependent methyltransferase [Yinghuangia sp.]